MDSLDKFEETLRRKYGLYSILADDHVSNEAYQHAGNAFHVGEHGWLPRHLPKRATCYYWLTDLQASVDEIEAMLIDQSLTYISSDYSCRGGKTPWVRDWSSDVGEDSLQCNSGSVQSGMSTVRGTQSDHSKR